MQGINQGESELGVIETWLSTFFVAEKFERDLMEKLAARLGLEPRQNESESFVLPLHHRAVENLWRGAKVSG